MVSIQGPRTANKYITITPRLSIDENAYCVIYVFIYEFQVPACGNAFGYLWKQATCGNRQLWNAPVICEITVDSRGTLWKPPIPAARSFEHKADGNRSEGLYRHTLRKDYYKHVRGVSMPFINYSCPLYGQLTYDYKYNCSGFILGGRECGPRDAGGRRGEFAHEYRGQQP